jgi:AcrR family transcriptional regulator
MSDQKRPYRMKQRAEAQEATRLRITESAVELHGRLGPSQTTMAAVAEHAGVRRSTLYRHFADEEALFDACSAHWYAQHPPPQIGRWTEVADPDERLVVALTELYAWYRSASPMLDLVIRDQTLVPSVGRRFSRFHEMIAAAGDLLMAGRRLRGATRTQVSALIDLSLRFETWRTLCREGELDDAEAIAMLAGLVTRSYPRRSATPSEGKRSQTSGS